MLFTCPNCGSSTDVAPQYVGQTGPCASCGKTVTVTLPPPQKNSSMIWWIVIPIVLVLMLFGGGAYFGLKGVQGAREAARNSHCKHNLKQIALAMHSHHDTHKRLPPAYITDENGTPLHSWRVLLLPYFEEQSLYEQIRLDEPWDSPHNRRFHSRMPEVYRCPSAGQSRGLGLTNYMVVVDTSAESGRYPSTIFGPGKLLGQRHYEGGSSMASIVDGTSNTIMIVEVAGSTTNWMEPSDLILQDQIVPNASSFGDCLSSLHAKGVNVAFADGSVRTLDETLSPGELKEMLCRDDARR